jgi:hypothetical protein
MKKFNFLSLLLTAGLALGLTACSNKDDEVTAQAIDDGSSYLRIAIALPNSAGTTRAGDADDSGIYETNNPNEAVVKKAMLYFYKNGQKVADKEIVNFSKVEGTPQSNTSEAAGTTKFLQSEAVKVDNLETGTYHVYAIINGELAANTDVNLEENIKDWLLSDKAPVNYNVDQRGIPMSTRTTEGATYAEVVIAEGVSYPKDNPLMIDLTAERAFAKIAISENHSGSNAANTFDILTQETTPRKYGEVEIQTVQARNLMDVSYAFRQVGRLTSALSEIKERSHLKLTSTLERTVAAEDACFYLIDPLILEKNGTMEGTALKALSTPLKDGATVNMPTASTDGSILVSYALENSMYRTEQLKGYGTYVLFTAKMKPIEGGEANKVRGEGGTAVVDYTPGNALVYYNFNFYESIQAVRDWNTAFADAEKYPDAKLAEFGVKTYESDICYYRFWPRHQDNNDNTYMGVNEFITCRNNLYLLKVSKIECPGDPGKEPPTDEKIELPEVYIQVTMNVKPWIVRSNESIELH